MSGKIGATGATGSINAETTTLTPCIGTPGNVGCLLTTLRAVQKFTNE